MQLEAIAYAKAHKKEIAAELTDLSRFPADAEPVSVFMAGSPGAGKTEFSKAVLALLEEARAHRVVRIDSDDFRARIPGYTGSNSYLFQGAVSVIAERVHDVVLSNQQSFIFDGTLANYDKAVENIRRSLAKGRRVFVFYVYQRPETAWRFTRAREQAEGRHIPRAAFIEQFLNARSTVDAIVRECGDAVTVMLVKKDFEKNSVEKIERITAENQIDAHIAERYTEHDLEHLL